MLTNKLTKYLLIFLLACFSLRASCQRFSEEIDAMLASEKSNAVSVSPILFIGSSSFTKWKDVNDYFPGMNILNRGFGGSTLTDQIDNISKIVFNCHPREIVIYCGENDLAESDLVSGKEVYNRFTKLFKLLRQHNDSIPIAFISLKPSPSRWQLRHKMITANRKIKKYLHHHHRGSFIDVYTLMLNDEGNPKQEIFVEDKLHMNAHGYQIWQHAIAPYLFAPH